MMSLGSDIKEMTGNKGSEMGNDMQPVTSKILGVPDYKMLSCSDVSLLFDLKCCFFHRYHAAL